MNAPQSVATAFERFNNRKPTEPELRNLLRKAAVIDDLNIDPIMTIAIFNAAIEETNSRAALIPKQLSLAAAGATAAIEAAGKAVVDRVEAIAERRGTEAAAMQHDGINRRVALAIGGVCCACALMLGVLVWRAGYGAGFDNGQGALTMSYRRYACEVQQSMAHVEARRGEAHVAAEIRRLSAGC